MVVTGTLADIAERARHLPPPATIVIGEVVRLAGNDPPALLDPRSRSDPLVAGVHELGEIVVRDDAFRESDTRAEKTSTCHEHSG